ncbi:MAG: hypothetical protein U5L72_19350 [Bacteroidales bacterium]|nr:hypothetical protein [Bacteroidales bacterium]
MVYRFVVLTDEDEAFIREFEFLDTQTLLEFHYALQEELEFDKSQIASFYLATESWEKEEEFTLFDMGAGSSTMENAVLEDVIFRKNQKLLYVFDFFNDRALFVEYVGEVKEEDGREYPACTNSKGLPPKQVAFGGVPAEIAIISLSRMTTKTMLMRKSLTTRSSLKVTMKKVCLNSTTSKILTR